MPNKLRFLSVLRESREFEEYLSAHEEMWLKQSRMQQISRVPGLQGTGSEPAPKLAISPQDLGGPQGIAKLRRSNRPEAELNKMISQAERERDYDKADRLIGFRDEFSMQRREISAGLRNDYEDLNSIEQKAKPSNQAQVVSQPTDSDGYLLPLETPSAEPEGSRTVRKNADGSISLQQTQPLNQAGIKVPFQDLKNHASGNTRLAQNDPILFNKAKALQQQVDATKQLSSDERQKRKAALEPQVVSLLQAIGAKPEQGPKAPETAPAMAQAGKGKTFSDFVSPEEPQAEPVGGAVSATDVLTGDGESPALTRKGQGKGKTNSVKARNQKPSGGGVGASMLNRGGKSRRVNDDQRSRVNPFSKRRTKDPNLSTQLELASKKITAIKKQMRSIIDQLKKEKNPVIKERLQQLLEGLDRQLGVAYVGLERIKQLSGLTAEVGGAEFEEMRDLFRETEKLSTETALETRKQPEVFKAQSLITQKHGTDSLKGLLAADNKKMKEKFGRAEPQDNSMVSQLMDKYEDKTLEQMEDIWNEQDAEFDELQQEILNDLTDEQKAQGLDAVVKGDDTKETEKQSDLTAFATGSEKEKVDPKVQRNRDLDSGDPERITAGVKAASKEINDYLADLKKEQRDQMADFKYDSSTDSDTKKPVLDPKDMTLDDMLKYMDQDKQKKEEGEEVSAENAAINMAIDVTPNGAKTMEGKTRTANLAHALLGLATIEMVSGESPFGAQSSSESTQIDRQSAYEPYEDKDSNINNVIQTVNAQITNNPGDNAVKISSPEDLASRFEDFTSREMEIGAQYYALTALATDLETMNQAKKNEIIDAFVSDEKSDASRKLMRPYIEKGINAQKDSPISLENEGETNFFVKASETVKRINRPQTSETPGQDKSSFLQGGAQLKALYQQLLKGDGGKKLPKNSKVVDFLVGFAKGENPPLPHNGYFNDNALLRNPTPPQEELLNLKAKENPSAQDRKRMERLEKKIAGEMARRQKKEAERERQRTERGVRDRAKVSGTGSLNFGESIDRWLGELLESIRMHNRISRENSYLVEGIHGDCHNYRAQLTREILHHLSLEGLQETIDHWTLVEGLTTEGRIRYKLAAEEFRSKNSYYWISEQRILCLEAAMATHSQLVEMHTNPVSRQVARQLNIYDNAEFLSCLIEVAGEKSDELAIKVSDDASKKAKVSSALKNKRGKTINAHQKRLMESVPAATGRRRLDLSQWRQS